MPYLILYLAHDYRGDTMTIPDYSLEDLSDISPFENYTSAIRYVVNYPGILYSEIK